MQFLPHSTLTQDTSLGNKRNTQLGASLGDQMIFVDNRQAALGKRVLIN